MLEEPDVIDIILKEKDGTPVLVITDAAITSDPAIRRKLLRAKFQTYVAALMSGDLEIASDPKTAVIKIVCAEDPQPVYGDLKAIEVTRSSGEAFRIPITLEYLERRF
jgi:hypothetical protein